MDVSLVRNELNSIIFLLSTHLIRKIILNKRLRRKKRIWMQNSLCRRQDLEASNGLLCEMRQLQMLPEKFDELLCKIESRIKKCDTQMRDAIPPKTKLEITLKFLTTGDSYTTLEKLYSVGKSTISKFIPEVCAVITTALKDFSKIPSRDEWKQIENGFRTKWNFPGCIGAIDGKHINIKAPSDMSEYFNYKSKYSVAPLALVDDNYCFSYVDTGCNERTSDNSIFAQSSLGQALKNNTLNVPEKSVIVGDAAFPLKPYLMKSFSEKLTYKEKIYNYRLSRARRIAENTFGILVSRFRIFQTTIALTPEKVHHIITAACSLHNWLRKTSDIYITEKCVDFEDTRAGVLIPGSWRQDINKNLENFPVTRSNRASNEALEVRNTYVQLFTSTEAVSWQDRMIHK